jgi:hypothetical protein
MDEGKAVGIRGMGFSLIRLDGAGQPDMKRYWKEVHASRPALLEPNAGKVMVEGNVVGRLVGKSKSCIVRSNHTEHEVSARRIVIAQSGRCLTNK